MDALRTLLSEYDVLAAFWMTIKLAVLSAIGSLIIGTVVAVCRVSPVAVLQWFGLTYVTLVRNTPLTLIVFFCAFGMSNTLGLTLAPTIIENNFRWGVVALSIYHASFVAEALRSGINTVPQGQAEAARALGLAFMPTLSTIILPQAFRGA
ncbi:MAG: glutamate transport system permease protein, partial [Propionibacteriaceae bacterium]|nr:glutamate transport system permease protein [Propionibacteriaceae bacterium]